MFKKIASIALLLILLSSFTAGSVSSAKGDQSAYTGFRQHGFFVQQEGFSGYPGMAEAFIAERTMSGPVSDRVTTTMVLDMSESQYVFDGGNAEFRTREPNATGPVFVHHEGSVLSNTTRGFITGKVILYSSDSPEPRSFPVQFERNFSKDLPDHFGPQSVFSTHMKFSKNERGELVPFTGAVAVGGISGTGSVEADIVEVNGDVFVDDSLMAVAMETAAMADTYTNTIVQGQDTYHSVDVSSAITSMNIDLKWNDTANALRLMIYTPDGHILGPYTDASDGTTDGRININVSNKDGLATGEWYLKVTGSDVTGADDYYVRTY